MSADGGRDRRLPSSTPPEHEAGVEGALAVQRERRGVVPSIWREPFGIVALEGIACGCVVVGSEGGGLKEAIGPCGVTFPNGDAEALPARLEALLSSPQLLVGYRAKAATHLSAYTKAVVAEKYLRIFAAAIQRRPPQYSSEDFLRCSIQFKGLTCASGSIRHGLE